MSRVTYANTADRADQEQLREAHGVRIVKGGEEGTGVDALPGGVYGYTYSPGLLNAPLFAARRYRCFETHKLVSGETFVVAYADLNTAAQLASVTSEVSIVVHPEASPEHPELVKVPYARIRQHRQYAAPNQDGFSVTLKPGAVV